MKRQKISARRGGKYNIEFFTSLTKLAMKDSREKNAINFERKSQVKISILTKQIGRPPKTAARNHDKSILVFIWILCIVTSPCYSIVVLNNQSMPDKRIWLFTEPHGMPPWNQASPYGSLYLLNLQEKDSDSPRYPIGQQLIEAGITGYIIGTNPGEQFNGWKSDMMANFTSNYPSIKLTICVASGAVSDIVYSVKSYIDTARHYSSSPQINGCYAIFTYAPQGTSLTDWQSVRSQLSGAGYPTFFFQDVNVNWNNGIPNASDITSWFPAFDGCYIWTDANYRNTDDWANWNWFISLMNTSGNRPCAGGLFAAYDRESPGGGYLEDSQGGYKGTYHLRTMLQGHLDSHIQWWHISTANDCSEESELLPSSWWNSARADITQLYAYKLGSITAKPSTAANLYAVTPQHIHVGESLYAEALIVNWSAAATKAKLELYDGANTLVTSSAMVAVTSDSTGAATVSGYAVNSLPARRFFRAKVLLYDANNTLLKSVFSAPICVYAANQSTALRNCNYYCVPERKVLAGTVSVSLQGNPATGTATMSVAPPGGITVRFAEVLQNTKLVYNGAKGQFIQNLASPYVVSLPTTSYTTAGGEVVNPERAGFYLARIIDNQERVGYSDPVYIDVGGVVAPEPNPIRVNSISMRSSFSEARIYNIKGVEIGVSQRSDNEHTRIRQLHLPTGLYVTVEGAHFLNKISFCK